MPPNLSCQDWVGSMNLKCGQGTDFMQRLVICYNALTGTLIMKHSLAFQNKILKNPNSQKKPAKQEKEESKGCQTNETAPDES